MSKSSTSFEKTVEVAAKAGMAIRIPGSKELFIDIDSKLDHRHFSDIIGKLPGVVGIAQTPSKSGYPKSHIVVTLDHEVTDLERICLQACLGSDRLHELLCYLASKQGNPSPTVFFEKR